MPWTRSTKLVKGFAIGRADWTDFPSDSKLWGVVVVVRELPQSRITYSEIWDIPQVVERSQDVLPLCSALEYRIEELG